MGAIAIPKTEGCVNGTPEELEAVLDAVVVVVHRRDGRVHCVSQSEPMFHVDGGSDDEAEQIVNGIFASYAGLFFGSQDLIPEFRIEDSFRRGLRRSIATRH